MIRDCCELTLYMKFGIIDPKCISLSSKLLSLKLTAIHPYLKIDLVWNTHASSFIIFYFIFICKGILLSILHNTPPTQLISTAEFVLFA